MVLTSTSFEYEMLAEPSSPQAPGTITCVRERELFDTVMRGMPANSLIHIGPGVFESKGTAIRGVLGWAPKSGQRVLGSGWGITTLKLVNASWRELEYTLIGHSKYYDFIEDFEASDLTFDCNIAGQPNQLVDCRAISINGKHVRLRRLRAINFSSQTIGYSENFVFAVGAPHPDAVGKEGVDCVIEGCIAEWPGLNPANNSSVFILTTGERETDGIMPWHRAFAIRQIWYDGTVTDRPVSIASITISGGVATVTTRGPHNRNDDDWVVIAGAVENGSAESAYNGTYKISNASEYQFTYMPLTYLGRGNAMLPVPTTNPTGDMWVDRFSSHPISVQKLERDPNDSTRAILTSYGPHNRKPGQWVRLTSVTAPLPAGTEPYYGRFPIIDNSITSPGVLTYQMNSAPSKLIVQDTDCQGAPTCQQDTIFLGVRNVGFSTDGGSEAVAEGNRVFNAGFGGSYHDTWGTKDQTDRNNYYSDVLTGPYQNMGCYSPGCNLPLKQGSLSVAGTTATFDTTNPHGLVVGQAVRIEPPLGTPAQNYFAVTGTPTSTKFTFEVTGTVTLAPAYGFGALWQVGLAIRENNVIELGEAHHLTTYGYSSGLPFYSGPHDTQYVFRSVITRDNLIRLIPGSSNPLARAIQLGNVERAVVENNVIDLMTQPPIYPMDVSVSQPLHFFNNQSSSGNLVQPTSGKTADDLRVRIEDALTLAL
jgi:hypothetical protein